ncbi:MAG: hypothetical protein Q8P82_02375 [bacterium]|nr:hypothetical protein [bacterium]
MESREEMVAYSFIPSEALASQILQDQAAAWNYGKSWRDRLWFSFIRIGWRVMHGNALPHIFLNYRLDITPELRPEHPDEPLSISRAQEAIRIHLLRMPGTLASRVAAGFHGSGELENRSLELLGAGKIDLLFAAEMLDRFNFPKNAEAKRPWFADFAREFHAWVAEGPNSQRERPWGSFVTVGDRVELRANPIKRRAVPEREPAADVWTAAEQKALDRHLRNREE